MKVSRCVGLDHDLFSMFSVENGSSIEREALYLEKEILMPLAGTGKALVYQTTKWWSQLKTPGAAVYANRHYLNVTLNTCFIVFLII